MSSLVVQATSDRACAIIDEQQRMATRSILASASGLAKWVLAGLESDRSGRPCDPATIEDVLPGNPSEAWTGMFPERLWEASVSRLGNLTLLEPPLHRRVGHAESTLKGTAYGESHDALTRDIHDEALLPWTPERIDSRQPRLAVHAVHLWRANFA